MSALTEIILMPRRCEIEGFQPCDGFLYHISRDAYYLGWAYTPAIRPGSSTNAGSRHLPELSSNRLLSNDYPFDEFFSPNFPNYQPHFLIFTTVDPDATFVHVGDVGPSPERICGDIGMIKMFASPTLPENWLECNGQELLIADYQGLFDVIGSKYGGNGTTTFVLPHLDSSCLSPIGKGPKFIISTSTPEAKEDYSNDIYGQIALFAGDTLPDSWVPCDGKMISWEECQAIDFFEMNCDENDELTYVYPCLHAYSINKGSVMPKFIMNLDNNSRGGDITVIDSNDY